MSKPHDKSPDRKNGMNPRHGSSSSFTNPPNPPGARRVGDSNDRAVVVSRGNDMVTEVTNRVLGSFALRGGRRLWRRHREPDPPAEVAQAARLLRRKTNPKTPKLPRPCRVCSLKFDCWRELFAHMRTHPEKESRGMREVFPPLDYPAKGEGRDHGSDAQGRELSSTLLHTSPRASKDHGNRNAAPFLTAGSRGSDVAAASQGSSTSGSDARASPPRRGLGFDLDLNKPPAEEEVIDDDDCLDLERLAAESDDTSCKDACMVLPR